MITLTENSKRIIFVVFFVLFSLAAGYALYYFFFRPTAPPGAEALPAGYEGQFGQAGPRGTVTTTQPTGPGTLPVAGGTAGGETGAAAVATGPSDVAVLRDSVTQAVSPDSKGNMRYYSPDDGRFYRINPDGSLALLSDKQFFDVQTVSWGNVSDEAILEFPDGSNVYYSFDDQRQVELPQHWTDFTFAPKQEEIVAKSIGMDVNNRFLITSKPDGNEATAVYHMGTNADLVIPSWSPNNQVIGFSNTGEAQPDKAQQIYLLGPNHEQYKALTVPGAGFVPNWSPTGKRLLYSVYHERDDNKPVLWVSDASGQDIGRNRQRLNLMTWADKCVWATDSSLICAVPVALAKGAGFDRNAYSDTPDDIYSIDLQSGASKKINTPDQNYPVRSPVLSQDKTKLMFTDAVTGKLYSYTLHY